MEKLGSEFTKNNQTTKIYGSEASPCCNGRKDKSGNFGSFWPVLVTNIQSNERQSITKKFFPFCPKTDSKRKRKKKKERPLQSLLRYTNNFLKYKLKKKGKKLFLRTQHIFWNCLIGIPSKSILISLIYIQFHKTDKHFKFVCFRKDHHSENVWKFKDCFLQMQKKSYTDKKDSLYLLYFKL